MTVEIQKPKFHYTLADYAIEYKAGNNEYIILLKDNYDKYNIEAAKIVYFGYNLDYEKSKNHLM